MDTIDRGWSAAEVDASELVDDAWIAANTRRGKRPNRARHLAGRTLQAVRTIGIDPLEGLEADAAADYHGISRKLPRMARRFSLQKGGLTRDQMRRIAARTGYDYVEAWSGHNKGAMKGVWGALVHHTGTSWSAAGDYPTLRVVRDGRPGLENSLCAFGLGRSGKIYLVNNLLSWHAGAGNWNGLTDGNGYMAGIEAESDGRNWTNEQRDAYPRLVAAILIEIGQDDKYTTRHASYATPAGRKIDASGLNMDAFWNQIYHYLAHPEQINRYYRASVDVIEEIRKEETDMAYILKAGDGSKTGVLAEGTFIGTVPGTDEEGNWINAGAKVVWVTETTWDAYAAGNVLGLPQRSGPAQEHTNRLLEELVRLSTPQTPTVS